MADKTKTIKGASDKELDELLARLRKESELQYLIGELKRKSSTDLSPYDSIQVSTEEPVESLYHMADKTKTIKELTDKELDELLIRLRKENELQGLIADIKRKSSRDNNIPYGAPQVSTEEPIESLYHFGIPGMKWGRRKGTTTIDKSTSNRNDSEDYKKKVALKKKKVREMSNIELKSLTERMQLEKQYKDLSPSEYKKGMNFVKQVTAAGTTLASLYALSKTPLGQDIKKVLVQKVK
jgi:hypothetical protein